jgi:SHS2 domain-containing protein
MPYEYLPDIALADVAFRAWGKTIEEMFAAAGDALINVMIGDLETIARRESRLIHAEDPDLDMLLFQMLQELVFFKDAEKLLLRVSPMTIGQEGDGLTLTAEAWGEKLDPARHDLGVDVKAVTLHRFRVDRFSEGWETEIVLDV